MLNVLREKGSSYLISARERIEDREKYFDYIDVDTFIEIVEEADFWNDIDAQIYEDVLGEYGLDYSDYDDPDMMWSDFLKAVEEAKEKELED